MKLYFCDRYDNLRVVADIDDRQSDEEILGQVALKIHEFCKERNFKIYYERIWHEERDGKLMTKFDVGSHTEFFYFERALVLSP